MYWPVRRVKKKRVGSVTLIQHLSQAGGGFSTWVHPQQREGNEEQDTLADWMNPCGYSVRVSSREGVYVHAIILQDRS